MKRPRRESGGGEVALMAVITKAMGAFLVLVVIMLPHYILVVNSSQSADKAQAAVDQAAANAGEIADRLKKGRLTKQEIDELLRKIDDLKGQLASLNDQIALLRNELNQTLAEVQRLKKTRDELEAEVARLKQELEARKTFEQPTTVAAITGADCPGIVFELYLYSDYVEPATRKKQPLPTRQIQGPFWTDERIGGTVAPDIARASGHIWWKTPDNNAAENLQLWVKLRNPINLVKAEPRKCDVLATLTTKSGQYYQTTLTLSDRDPFRFTQQSKLADGSIAGFDPKKIPWDKLTSDFATSPCEKLLCYVAGRGDVFTAPPDRMKEEFIASINTHSEAGEAPAAVFDEMANGTLTVNDAFRWLSVFPVKNSPPRRADVLTSLSEIYDVVRKKGASYALRSEVFRLVKQDRLSFRTIEESWRELKDRPMPTDDLPQVAKDLFREFGDAVDASVKSRALSSDEASIWKSSLNSPDVAWIRAGLLADSDKTPTDDEIDQLIQTAATSTPKQFGRDRARTELRTPPELMSVIRKMIQQRVYAFASINTAFLRYESKYGK